MSRFKPVLLTALGLVVVVSITMLALAAINAAAIVPGMVLPFYTAGGVIVAGLLVALGYFRRRAWMISSSIAILLAGIAQDCCGSLFGSPYAPFVVAAIVVASGCVTAVLTRHWDRSDEMHSL